MGTKTGWEEQSVGRHRTAKNALGDRRGVRAGKRGVHVGWPEKEKKTSELPRNAITKPIRMDFFTF